MADRGRPVEVGFLLIPNADEHPRLVEQAELADRLGLDYIGVQDHPYQPITTGAFGGFLDGPADHWADALAGLAMDEGMDTFIFRPREDPIRQMEVFANEVVPVVRERVVHPRGS
jgi:hypothetical protein